VLNDIFVQFDSYSFVMCHVEILKQIKMDGWIILSYYACSWLGKRTFPVFGANLWKELSYEMIHCALYKFTYLLTYLLTYLHQHRHSLFWEKRPLKGIFFHNSASV